MIRVEIVHVTHLLCHTMASFASISGWDHNFTTREYPLSHLEDLIIYKVMFCLLLLLEML